MKYLTILLMLVVATAQAQLKITETGSVIWQKVYDAHLDWAGQETLGLSTVGEQRMKLPIWLASVVNAKIKAEHKDGKTRITVWDVYYDTQSLGAGYADSFATKTKKGKLVNRKTFISLAFDPLNRMITRKVEELVNQSTW